MPSNPVVIGAGYVNNYDGQIDELRVWNTARTQSNIQNNKDTCLMGIEIGLVGYWKMEDGSGTTLTDYSNSSNNGTLTNGPTWVKQKS